MNCLEPTKIKCFTWLIDRQACQTHKGLQNREIKITSTCFLVMSIQRQIVIYFCTTRWLATCGSLTFSLCGIMWTMLEHTAYLLSCWIKSQKWRWGAIPSRIWWIVWKEWNKRCFENSVSSLQKFEGNCLLISISGLRRNIEDVV